MPVIRRERRLIAVTGAGKPKYALQFKAPLEPSGAEAGAL